MFRNILCIGNCNFDVDRVLFYKQYHIEHQCNKSSTGSYLHILLFVHRPKPGDGVDSFVLAGDSQLLDLQTSKRTQERN